MFKRFFILLALLLGLLLAILLYVIGSGENLSKAINLALPEDWKITTTEGIRSNFEDNASLPDFTLTYKDCPLISAENLSTHFSFKNQLSKKNSIGLDKATIDYSCFSKFPTSEEESVFSIKGILKYIPSGEANIEQLYWVNLPKEMSPRLKQLLNSPSQTKITNLNGNLTASLKQKVVSLNATYHNQQLNADLNYNPSKNESHHLTASAQINDDIISLPKQLTAHYQWKLPAETIADKSLQEGMSDLNWQADNNDHLTGNWSLASKHFPENKLSLPLIFDGTSITVKQGKIDWDATNSKKNNGFPLHAYVNTTFTPKSFNLDDLYPIKTQLKFSVLSQNEMGKGNIVISNQDGILQKDSMILPLQITGNVKHGNFVLYSAMPIAIDGKFDDLTLRFKQKALLRIAGKERYLNIKDLRFPLAGIRVNKHGIKGRLQAIFRGESPDFDATELHIGGFANNFKAGLLDIFEDPTEKGAVKDQWNWRFWGDTTLKAFKNKASISGRGNWHKELVTLSEFKGNLGRVTLEELKIEPATVTLLEPITFAYKEFKLNGGILFKTPEIHFRYGGTLPQPTAKLHFNGEIENLNFKGEVTADKLGPVSLFARRRLTKTSSEIIGKLYWKEQSAKVFQPLFPFRQNWIINGGTIRGETSFSASVEKGLIAGGHFAIRNGSMSLPSGDVSGIEFSLPYRFQDNLFSLGIKKPLLVTIKNIDLGGTPLTNARMKLRGYYPYSKKRPLNLSELSFDLFEGSLSVEKYQLPQTKIAYLKLHGISLENLLHDMQYSQVELKGKIDATMPFWLDGKPCYICNGTITQSNISHLKFSDELLEAMKKSGYTEKILLALVNDSNINELNANVDVETNGDMNLRAKVKTSLVERDNAKVNLNYNHKENLFDLWRTLNYGSQFEQKIENKIYQKLDTTIR